MKDVHDLVHEFRTSSNGAVGAPFFAMRFLLGILQKCLDYLEVCFDMVSFFANATPVDLTDNNLQDPYHFRAQSVLLEDEISLRDRFKKLFDGYRKMIDQSFSKSKDLGDMLRFLPGVVVQRKLSMQGMADLYRIKPDFLERLIKSIELLGRDLYHRYRLDDYLSGFLQDRDRSQHYYCDPELQHISICRQILSFLDLSNIFDLQS